MGSELAVARPTGIVPQTLAELDTFATTLMASSVVPEALRKNKADLMIVLLRAIETKIGMMEAFDTYCVIKGKLVTHAAAKVAFCLREKDTCKYFRLVETDIDHATYETQRAGSKPVVHTYTAAQARRAGLYHLDEHGNPPIVDQRYWENGQQHWKKGPCQCAWCKDTEAMLRHRCSSQLAGIVYSDLVRGMRDEDEAQEIVEAEAIENGVSGSSTSNEVTKPDMPKRGMKGLAAAIETSAREVIDTETGEVTEMGTGEKPGIAPAPPVTSPPPAAPGPKATPEAKPIVEPPVTKLPPKKSGGAAKAKEVADKAVAYLEHCKNHYQLLAVEAKKVGISPMPLPENASAATILSMGKALREIMEDAKRPMGPEDRPVTDEELHDPPF
jgi:hypothetical protein